MSDPNINESIRIQPISNKYKYIYRQMGYYIKTSDFTSMTNSDNKIKRKRYHSLDSIKKCRKSINRLFPLTPIQSKYLFSDPILINTSQNIEKTNQVKISGENGLKENKLNDNNFVYNHPTIIQNFGELNLAFKMLYIS